MPVVRPDASARDRAASAARRRDAGRCRGSSGRPGSIRSSISARFSLPASSMCRNRCSSGPSSAGRSVTSMVNARARRAGWRRRAGRRARRRTRPRACRRRSTTRGEPRRSTGVPADPSSRGRPDVQTIGRRRVAAGMARPRSSAAATAHRQRRTDATARHGRASSCADQHAHVADVGLDRDALQRFVRVRRGVGLVAHVGREKSPGAGVFDPSPLYGWLL